MNNWIAFALFSGCFFPLGFANAQDSTRTMTYSTVVAKKNLPRDDWLGKDKFDHAMVSAGLVAAQFYFFHTEQNWERQKSQQLAAASTLAIGIAKEIYDGLSRRGTASWKDLLADLAGIALAVAVFAQ